MSNEHEGNYLVLIEEARNALVQKDNIISRLTNALESKSEMADIGGAIVSAGKWFTIAEAAKEFNIRLDKKKVLGQNQLYAFFRNTGLLMRKEDRTGEPPFWSYHQPYQTELDTGRMKLEEKVSYQYEGKISRTALISAKGLPYYRKKIEQAIEEDVIDDLLS